jgi:hypothetical protein
VLAVSEKLPPRILITDTGPLITLAAADTLDYLLILKIPVIIPDAVYFEATNVAGALGAQDIIDWTKMHIHDVHIVTTSAFASYLALLKSGQEVPKDTGERSAIEVGRDTSWVNEGESCLIISEDFKVLDGKFSAEGDETRIELVSTHEFLTILEESQKINSVDAVYKRAEDAGRFAAFRESRRAEYERAMELLGPLLKREE